MEGNKHFSDCLAFMLCKRPQVAIFFWSSVHFPVTIPEIHFFSYIFTQVGLQLQFMIFVCSHVSTWISHARKLMFDEETGVVVIHETKFILMIQLGLHVANITFGRTKKHFVAGSFR